MISLLCQLLVFMAGQGDHSIRSERGYITLLTQSENSHLIAPTAAKDNPDSSGALNMNGFQAECCISALLWHNEMGL